MTNVYLYRQKENNRLLIVDGLQRVHTIVSYFNGDFKGKPFVLKGVNRQWEGRSFDMLVEFDQNQLRDATMRATIIQQLDPDDFYSIFYIFERLNTGGVELFPMEVRRCIYRGMFCNALEEMNQNPAWRKILGKPHVDARLGDVELVLRVIALADQWQGYVKPMANFLNKYMIQNRMISQENLQKIKENFAIKCQYIVDNLGEKPFHAWNNRFNTSAMDSIFGMVVSRSENIQDIKERVRALWQDAEYLEGISKNTSDTQMVKRRFTKAHLFDDAA